jgi:hypothetical protein
LARPAGLARLAPQPKGPSSSPRIHWLVRSRARIGGTHLGNNDYRALRSPSWSRRALAPFASAHITAAYPFSFTKRALCGNDEYRPISRLLIGAPALCCGRTFRNDESERQ